MRGRRNARERADTLMGGRLEGAKGREMGRGGGEMENRDLKERPPMTYENNRWNEDGGKKGVEISGESKKEEERN